MIDVKEIKKQFSFFKNNKNVVYLDTAASSIKLDKAIDLENKYYKENGTNVFRGAYNLSYLSTKDYELAREKTAKFINASFDEIVFTKGTTQSLNLIANSASNFLKKGENMITSYQEHNSSYLPWYNQSKKIGFKIKYINTKKDNIIDIKEIIKLIDDKTRVIQIAFVSNTLGYIAPIKEIAKICRKRNIILITDAAQAASHIKIDVKDLDVDFLAFSSHKMYGPTGLGILYGKKDSLKLLSPYEFGGEMVQTVSKDSVLYKTPPYNLEAGTPPIAQAIGFIKAIEFLETIGLENIHNYEKELAEYCFLKLSKIKDVLIVNKQVQSGIISFNLKDIHPHDAASGYDMYNICLRAGLHCAGLFMEKNNLENGTIRLSLGIYNTKKDIDKFISATKKIIKFFKGMN